MAHSPEFKLQVLDHYHRCSSIERTSKDFGVARQTIYNWQTRHLAEGPQGLVDRSRAHHSHSQATPPETVAHILQLALQNPTSGGTEIADLVEPPHARVSPQTINAMLARSGLSTSDQRWVEHQRYLRGREGVAMMHGVALRSFLLARNARYRDWDFCGKRPGEAVAFGQVKLGNLNGVGRVWLSCAVDSYCCLAFGRLHVGRPAGALTEGLERAVDFFDALNLTIERVKLHRCPWVNQQCATLFAAALDGRKIRLAGVFDVTWPTGFVSSTEAQLLANRRGSGLVVQFAKDLRSAWLDGLDRRRRFAIDELVSEFNGWLDEFNQHTVIGGYPNYGLSPMAALQRWQAAN